MILQRNNNWLINAFIFLLAFYPPLPVFNFINPIILLICICVRKDTLRMPFPIVLIIVSIYVSLVFNMIVQPENINLQSISRALVVAGIFLFFPYAENEKINNNLLYLCVVYLLFSQISYFIGFNRFISFYETYYPYVGDIQVYTSDYLSQQTQLLGVNTRLGGLYHNPNHCARAYTLFLATYFIENERFSIKKAIFCFICLFGIILTGSRTGLFVAILLMLGSYYWGEEKNRPQKSGRILGGIIALGILYLFYSFFDSGSYRALRLEEGTGDSLTTKFVKFADYVNSQHNFLYLLFGNFDQHSFLKLSKDESTIDSEWGFAIYNYGLIFLIGYILFYITTIKRLKSIYKLIMIPLLWTITSGILFAYKFSLLFYLLFSLYYYRSTKLNTEND